MTQPGNGPLPTPEEFVAQFQKLNEQFVAAWGATVASFMASGAGQQATIEAERNYVAARAMLARAAREVWGPLIEAAGAVPLSEFQRLADQVQFILERLDAIDDRLDELLARPDGASEATNSGAAKSKKKR
jgi:hypothetical protein